MRNPGSCLGAITVYFLAGMVVVLILKHLSER
jgi:hypothetical protein